MSSTEFTKRWSEPHRQWAVYRYYREESSRQKLREGSFAWLDGLLDAITPITVSARASCTEVAYYATEAEADEGLKRWRERCP